MLIAAKLAVRCFRLQTIFDWADKAPRNQKRFADDEVAWISWAIESNNRRRLIGAVGLPSALAAQMMLRRRRIHSTLCLGAAKDGDSLLTHYWLQIEDRVVVGDAQAPARFTPLAEFGLRLDRALP